MTVRELEKLLSGLPEYVKDLTVAIPEENNNNQIDFEELLGCEVLTDPTTRKPTLVLKCW